MFFKKRSAHQGTLTVIAAALFALFPGTLAAQRARAPVDITGYWTALITDDWEYRMVTPAKGEIQFIPLNDAARKIAVAWDPAADEKNSLQCKGYGAPAVMRLPTRLRIEWQDENTLKIETDFGTQTRLLRFGPQPAKPGERTWQGHSIAEWEAGPGAAPRGNSAQAAPSPEQVQEAILQNPGATAGPGSASRSAARLNGTLKAVTTNLRAGYLRKNGVPYSENAVLTEWFNSLEDGGAWYLVVQTQIEDPTYLTMPFFRTLQFKKEPNGSKWNPTPCSSR